MNYLKEICFVCRLYRVPWWRGVRFRIRRQNFVLQRNRATMFICITFPPKNSGLKFWCQMTAGFGQAAQIRTVTARSENAQTATADAAKWEYTGLVTKHLSDLYPKTCIWITCAVIGCVVTRNTLSLLHRKKMYCEVKGCQHSTHVRRTASRVTRSPLKTHMCDLARSTENAEFADVHAVTLGPPKRQSSASHSLV